jgi:hypothetical protein
VTITGDNGEPAMVKRMEAWDAVKVVEVYQMANGDMSTQHKVISDKITAMGTGIRDNWVPRRTVWQGYRSMILPVLKYPLPACTFTKKQSDQLTKALYKLILPNLGLVQSFPNVYRYAPHGLQGLELSNFHVHMEAEKIGYLLIHGDTSSLMGQLLGISLEQAQLEVGIGSPILQAPFSP